MEAKRTFMGRIIDNIEKSAQSDEEKGRMLKLSAFILDELSAELKLQFLAMEANIRQEGA